MDPCLGYLREIDILMESYEELPLYEDIFEAADPEVEAKTAKNAEIEAQSMNLLERAITAIRNIFKRIGEIIKTIFTWLGMDSDEKTKFKKFEEECKRNPEFKDMKVTLHNYREINKEWETFMSNEEKKYKSIKESELESKPNIITDIEDGIKNLSKKTLKIAGGVLMSFTVEYALNYARTCREHAAKVQMAIDFDMGLLDMLEKELGKKQIKKFKRQVKILQCKTDWIRKIAGGRRQQAMTLKDTLHETLTNIDSVGSAVRRAEKGEHGKDLRDLERGVMKAGLKPLQVNHRIDKETNAIVTGTKNARDKQLSYEQHEINKARRQADKENRKRDKK